MFDTVNIKFPNFQFLLVLEFSDLKHLQHFTGHLNTWQAKS